MKDIEGYEGLYAITSCGRVWSYRRKKFLKPEINARGYLRITLTKNYQTKKVFIHRLVATAYIPNPNNYDTVDHIDNNKEHNYINNLQWMSKENNIKKEQNQKIRCIETNTIYPSQMEAARQTGISQGNISMVLNNKREIAGGYHWEEIKE